MLMTTKPEPLCHHRTEMTATSFFKLCVTQKSDQRLQLLIELADRLYLDRGDGKPSSISIKNNGADKTKAGNVRRYAQMLDQFEMTYDVFGMSADEVEALLPAEFAF
jgi:hypothetical protein